MKQYYDNIDNIITELYDKFIHIKKVGWIKGNKKNKGAAGILFEELIGNTYNNFELPDYKGIEIKTKYSSKEKYISLFSAVPDSFLFEIKRIVESYGYPDKDYPQFNIFNMDIYSFKYNKSTSNYIFKLDVDLDKKQVILKVFDSKFNLIDDKTRWSFELLKEKLERKLSYLAFIKVEKLFLHNEVFFKYNQIEFYKLIDFDTFIKLLKKGNIKLTFRIGIYKDSRKLGNLYDHGSSFNIKTKNLEKLFQKVSI